MAGLFCCCAPKEKVVPTRYTPTSEQSSTANNTIGAVVSQVAEIIPEDIKLVSSSSPFGDVVQTSKGLFTDQASEDGDIDAYQLRDILNNTVKQEYDSEGFCLDVCRSMVAVADPDLSGRLSEREASLLFDMLRKWTDTYESVDVDKQGYFPAEQFASILSSLDINGNERTNTALIQRYKNREGQIYYQDFIACMIRLASMLDVYQGRIEESPDDKANFTLDEFMQLTLYS